MNKDSTDANSDQDSTGFFGRWACGAVTTYGTQDTVTCGRFLPRATKDNVYTKDFRFSPKKELGGTNPTPPDYNFYTMKEKDGDDKWAQINSLKFALKHATALVVTATAALTTTMLI